MPERSVRLDRDALFDAAVELGDEELETFLETACAGSPELRREVEALVRADRRAGGFLESPPLRLAPQGAAQADDAAGERMGPYRLLELLHSGGMAAVYRARLDADPASPDLAVKLLRPSLLTPSLAARFHAEGRILAGLRHPSIARFYDAGSTRDGHLFLAMELVEGRPLDDHVRRAGLGVEARLRLFLEVCRAVEYVHAQGLIHRDLKPGNLLVREDGSPKLLDFGIAKLVAPGPVDPQLPTTATGVRPMTLRYASPEQVQGKLLTPATDVYSLGVLLFELLTGRSPYAPAGDTPLHLEHAICEQVPPRPGAVTAGGRAGPRLLEATVPPPPEAARRRRRKALDTVTLTALAKEPRERYPSVARLAEDLERVLAGRPILARRQAFARGAGRFLRRHRLAAAASGAVLAALVTAAVGVVGLYRDQRRLLERQQDRAREAVEVLSGVMETVGTGSGQGVGDLGDRLSALGQQQLDANPDRPELAADIRYACGRALLALGLYGEAVRALTDAVERRRELYGESDLEVAAAARSLADALAAGGEYSRAEELYRTALEAQLGALGEDSPEVAATLDGLAAVRGRLGHPQEAVDLLRRALEIRRRQLGAQDPKTLESQALLASELLDAGRYLEAWRLLRSTDAVDTTGEGMGDAMLTAGRLELGSALADLGKLEEAEVILRRSLETARLRLPPDHPRLAEVVYRLGAVLRQRGKAEEAQPLLEESAAIYEQRLGPRHPTVADVLNELAAVLVATGELDRAETLMQRVLALRLEVFGENHRLVALSLNDLGWVKVRQGELDAAVGYLERSIEALRGVFGEGHLFESYTRMNLAYILLRRGRNEAAEAHAAAALAIRRRRLPPGHFAIAGAQAGLADCLIRQGRLDEAQPLIEGSHAVYIETLGPDDRRTRAVGAILDRYRRARAQERPG